MENSAPKHVVLVVDDFFLTRRTLQLFFDKMGIVVSEAKNGQEALDILNAQGPDIFFMIIVDLKMPVMNGKEFILKAKQIYKDKLPPLLVCSSTENADDIKEIVSLGIDGYIMKPIDFNVMKKKINELLLKRR